MRLNDSQVREVEAALGGLVGLPLVAASLHAPGPLLWFAEPRRLPALGARPAGGRALWTLAVACAWGLEGSDGAIRAEGRPWEIGDAERKRFASLVDVRRLVVGISARDDGALRIGLDGGHALFVLPGGPFDLESEPQRADLRWSLEAPDDDPRGALALRLGRLAREPMPEPPTSWGGTIINEMSHSFRLSSQDMTDFGYRFWEEP